MTKDHSARRDFRPATGSAWRVEAHIDSGKRRGLPKPSGAIAGWTAGAWLPPCPQPISATGSALGVASLRCPYPPASPKLSYQGSEFLANIFCALCFMAECRQKTVNLGRNALNPRGCRGTESPDKAATRKWGLQAVSNSLQHTSD